MATTRGQNWQQDANATFIDEKERKNSDDNDAAFKNASAPPGIFLFFLANLHFLKWRHFWSNQHPFFSFFFSTLHMAALIASYPPPSLICGIHWSNKRWRLLLLYSQIILLLLVKEEISSFENVEIIKKLFCKYVILKTLNWWIFSFWLSFPRKKIGLLQAEAASWRREEEEEEEGLSYVVCTNIATSNNRPSFLGRKILRRRRLRFSLFSFVFEGSGAWSQNRRRRRRRGLKLLHLLLLSCTVASDHATKGEGGGI